MAHNPRYSNWGPRQWANVAPTIGDVRRLGWPVHARCQLCQGEFKVRLALIERLHGPAFRLWGRRAPCPRRSCVGRVFFVAGPPRADGDVWML